MQKYFVEGGQGAKTSQNVFTHRVPVGLTDRHAGVDGRVQLKKSLSHEDHSQEEELHSLQNGLISITHDPAMPAITQSRVS